MIIPIIKNITPPTTLKLFTEIPKKLNRSCPVKAKATIVISDTIEAFFAVLFLSTTDRSAVIDINTGIVPNGFIKVKSEVIHKSPNEIVSVILFFYKLFIKFVYLLQTVSVGLQLTYLYPSLYQVCLFTCGEVCLVFIGIVFKSILLLSYLQIIKRTLNVLNALGTHMGIYFCGLATRMS